MSEPTRQETPTAVPREEGAKQVGDPLGKPPRGLTLESSAVWTPPMLATLERGVKGGRWYSLIDKVWNENTLKMGAWAVIRNGGAPGIDHRTTQQLKEKLDEEVSLLARQLREGSYQPQPVKRVWIEKAGSKDKRPLGIPVVRDRVVQAAMRAVIEPIFEHEFAQQSYGFRPGRGAQEAIYRVEQLLDQGLVWVVDADLKSYFDTIDQGKLMERIGQRISDGRLLGLIEAFLRQGVLDTVKGWQPTQRGTPQGAVLSPLLANIYLNPLDHLMAQAGIQMIRYADDFILMCRTQSQAQAALELVGQWVKKAGLTLHPDKTRLVDASQPGGFEFLGWHFERGKKWPRPKSVNRLKESLRQLTPRNSGESLPFMIVGINRRLKGWGGYFRGGVGDTYVRIDQWLRMRLRSILRRRAGRRGRGRGLDHQRYPNSHFVNLGLISLQALAQGQRASPA